MESNKKTLETFKKMCELALQSKTMCNVKIDVDFNKSTKCKDPEPPKFICQSKLEINDKCDVQCKHCKEYFGGLQEEKDFDIYVKQECIAFGIWLIGNYYIEENSYYLWTDGINLFNTKQLYEIYQKNITDTATACR
jgi:hypothetical protein